MPFGLKPQEVLEMTTPGLRELNAIATRLRTESTIDSLKQEYAELADLTLAEIQRRESAASMVLVKAIGERRERIDNRAADHAKVARAKEILTKAGIDISVDPTLISTARLYHLCVLLEALEIIAAKNPYLTKHASSKVKRSALPNKQLKAEYDAADKEWNVAFGAIKALVDKKIEENIAADRAMRLVPLPANFKQQGSLVDYKTFLYPGGGEVIYNQARTYLLAPNRSMIHVKDDLPAGASPQLAGRYLAALVLGCRQFVDQAGKTLGSGAKIKVMGTLPSGREFFWTMMGKETAGMPGYAGEIYHIDSGYANSRWHGQ